METLKRHLPISVPEGLNELQKIAIRFEEKIYTAAANQVDSLVLSNSAILNDYSMSDFATMTLPFDRSMLNCF